MVSHFCHKKERSILTLCRSSRSGTGEPYEPPPPDLPVGYPSATAAGQASMAAASASEGGAGELAADTVGGLASAAVVSGWRRGTPGRQSRALVAGMASRARCGAGVIDGVLGRHRRSLSRLRVQWADPGPLRPDLMRWLDVGLQRVVRRAMRSVLLQQLYQAVASAGIRCLCARSTARIRWIPLEQREEIGGGRRGHAACCAGLRRWDIVSG
jgi:hypothetical protein